jgi:type I restriction enzyme R subunit
MLDGIFRRRRLPHWDAEDATYFVTACLADSVPAQGLLRLRAYRQQLESPPPPAGMSSKDWEDRKHKLVFAELDDIIDTEPAVRHLANQDAAGEVESALRHFAGQRDDLLAYVVMPSHFHWVFHPRAEWANSCAAPKPGERDGTRRTPRQRIMQTVKGYSAYRCNRLLGLEGTFWQDEAYDHVVRNDHELFRIIQYVENNPVKAGLVAAPRGLAAVVCAAPATAWHSNRHAIARTVVPVGQTFLSAIDHQLLIQQTRMSAPRNTFNGRQECLPHTIMIRVELPYHLRTLGKISGEVQIDVEGPVTQRTVLDALEARYPMLCGTIRDHDSGQRRAFVRFFACQEDLSNESPDTPLPAAVASGQEAFLVVGALAGG